MDNKDMLLERIDEQEQYIRRLEGIIYSLLNDPVLPRIVKDKLQNKWRPMLRHHILKD